MLDATFGTAGLVSGVLASGTFGSSGITVQPDGKIVAAGSFIRTDAGWRVSLRIDALHD